MADTRPAAAPLLRLLAGAVKLSRAKLQRELETHGVHAGQDYLLELLWEDDRLSVGEIAARLGIEVPTVVRTAQRMEAAGIVTREPDPGDGRRSLIVLTERGRELQPVVLDALRSVSSAAMDGLSDDERAQLIDLLTRVRRNLLTA
jgi:MarR family transcriptional regulator, organic hydroperoxide resistance regulator